MKLVASSTPTPRELRLRPYLIGCFYFSLILLLADVAGVFLDHFSIGMPVGNLGTSLFFGFLLLVRSRPALSVMLGATSFMCSLLSLVLVLVVNHH